MRRPALAGAICALLSAGPATAHHVDPFEVIDRAFETYKQTEDYGKVRAIFSEALRAAPHEGQLAPEFGLLFAIYSDTVRFDGNPSFALLLADEGLALVASAAEPDVEMRNALSTSRAYALADLGRYREAVESATIAAVWLEERFGKDQREALEAEMRDWAAKEGGDGELPSAATIAVDLLQQAEQAILRNDTGTAIQLASRATLPDGAGLSEAAVRLVNSWSLSVTGAAYSVEGRHETAVTLLRDAVDLIADRPWDGAGKVTLLPELDTDISPRIAWDIFIRLASSAVFTRELALADIALQHAADYATTAEARFSLLVQRASLLMQSGDPAAVEAVLRDSEAEAIAAGNMENAALARFYAAVAHMRIEDRAPDAPEVAAMLDAAREAAKAAEANPVQVEYILANAAQQAIDFAFALDLALPVARDAFKAFGERQKTFGGYEDGQEVARRERRKFLETYVDTLFEVDRR
jgi:hypothetical protein